MGSSAISLGLGLGGGKSATSSGTPGGTPFANQYSVSFDGSDDYMDVNGVATDIAGMTNFSCSAWIKKDTAGSFPIIFRAASSTSIHIGFYEYNNYLVVSCNNGGSFSEAWDNGGVNIADNQWHHVLMTYEKTGATNSTVKGYVDGNLRITNSSNGVISSSIDEAAVGRRPNGTGGGDLYYPGLIDEMAIFNTTLSSSDVTAIYNSGVPADIRSLSPVGWWRMGDNDGGTGTTITDQGNGGNDGTLTNGPTFSTTVPS